MLAEYVIWALRVVSAAVFVAAAFGKFTEPNSVRHSLADFGAPARLVAPGALALPVTELVVAVLVLFPATAVAGCVAALVLLAMFTVAVGVQLRRGRRPRCSCFGVSAPVSGWTVVRNAGFAVLAASALVGSVAVPGLPWMLPTGPGLGLTAVLVLTVVQVRQAILLRVLRAEVAVLRANRPRTGGLPADTPAPDFELPDVTGRRTNLAALLAEGRPAVLLFVHPDCAMCTMFAAEFAYWRARAAGRITLVPIGGGDPETNAAWADRFDVTGLLVQHRAEVAGRYRLHSTPAAVLVDPRGRIAGPPARTLADIRELLTAAVEESPVGAAA